MFVDTSRQHLDNSVVNPVKQISDYCPIKADDFISCDKPADTPYGFPVTRRDEGVTLNHILEDVVASYPWKITILRPFLVKGVATHFMNGNYLLCVCVCV